MLSVTVALLGGDSGRAHGDSSSGVVTLHPAANTLRIRDAASFSGSPRVGSSASYDPVTNRVYVHGGVERIGETSSVRYLDEMWAYDLDHDRWIAIAESETRPGPRVFHATAIDVERRKFYLFGGKAPGTEFGCSVDLWSMSLDTFEWALESSGNPDVFFGLQDPLLEVHPASGDVWVHFGGCDQEVVPPYYFRWSAVSGTWTPYVAGLHEARRRYAGLSAYDPLRDRILITGGSAGGATEEGSRLWRSVLSFDPLAITWEQLTDGAEDPPMRGWMVGGFDDLSDLFVSYGGYVLWPSRGCNGCPGSATLATFDMKNRTWISVEGDTSHARVYAAGDYCRCTGELFVHAGSRSPSLALRFRDRFQSQAYLVGVEHPARFRWLTPSGQRGRDRAVRGILELVEPLRGRIIERPVLIDCAARETLQIASEMHDLGGDRFRIIFSALSAAVLDAWSRDRLILVGRIENDSKAYLARIRPEPRMSAPAQTSTLDSQALAPELRVRRVERGWELTTMGGTTDALVRFSVYDVRGRRVFSADVESRLTNPTVVWDGRDTQGRASPQGVYFVRAEWGGISLRARFVLVRP